MLQSTVNLLGNTSVVWNNQYLKKILKIPEDQLKILNNIPGWSSARDNNKPSSPLPSVRNKNNLVVSSKAQTEVIEPKESKKNPVVNSEEIDKQLEETNKESFPLRKSSSLNSVSIKKSNFCQRKLKRSSSTSNIKEKTIILENTSWDILRSKAILTEKSSLSSIKEVAEMQVDMNSQSFEKSSFSNSGVQCKMSQDFNSELNGATHTILPSSCNNSLKRQTLKLLNTFSPSKQTNEGEEIVEKLNLLEDENNQFANVGALLKERLNGNSKIDIDENNISLPVPCAQPTSENAYFDKEIVTDQKESISVKQNKFFCSTSKETQSSLDKINPHHSGKRKRKSKQEKSKKHRGAADSVKIEYSSEQIMNMFGLLKILHKQ